MQHLLYSRFGLMTMRDHVLRLAAAAARDQDTAYRPRCKTDLMEPWQDNLRHDDHPASRQNAFAR